jgi:hypothetical protein
MHTVILAEFFQFPLQIAGVPEEYVVEALYTARELIHDYEHPMALQTNGFTPEQVNAPEAVLHVAGKGQPRRPTITGIWVVMSGKNTPHHIFRATDVPVFHIKNKMLAIVPLTTNQVVGSSNLSGRAILRMK